MNGDDGSAASSLSKSLSPTTNNIYNNGNGTLANTNNFFMNGVTQPLNNGTGSFGSLPSGLPPPRNGASDYSNHGVQFVNQLNNQQMANRHQTQPQQLNHKQQMANNTPHPQQSQIPHQTQPRQTAAAKASFPPLLEIPDDFILSPPTKEDVLMNYLRTNWHVLSDLILESGNTAYTTQNVIKLKEKLDTLRIDLLKYGRNAMQEMVLSSFQKKNITSNGSRLVKQFSDCTTAIKGSGFFDYLFSTDPLDLVTILFDLLYNNNSDDWLQQYVADKLMLEHDPPLDFNPKYGFTTKKKHKSHVFMTVAKEGARKALLSLEGNIEDKYGIAFRSRKEKVYKRKTNNVEVECPPSSSEKEDSESIYIDISSMLTSLGVNPTKKSAYLVVNFIRHPAFHQLHKDDKLSNDEEKKQAISNLLATNRTKFHLQQIISEYHVRRVAMPYLNDYEDIEQIIEELRHQHRQIRKSIRGIAPAKHDSGYKARQKLIDSNLVSAGGGVRNPNNVFANAKQSNLLQSIDKNYISNSWPVNGSVVNDYRISGADDYEFAGVGGGTYPQGGPGAGVGYPNSGVNPNNQGGAGFPDNQDDPIANDDGKFRELDEILIQSLQTESEKGEDDDSDEDEDEDGGKQPNLPQEKAPRGLFQQVKDTLVTILSPSKTMTGKQSAAKVCCYCLCVCV